MRLAASCNWPRVWVPVATFATKACSTSGLKAVAPVMLMLLTGMGVGSVLLGVADTTVPVWGKATLLAGAAGLVTTASRMMLPAFGVCAKANSALNKPKVGSR